MKRLTMTKAMRGKETDPPREASLAQAFEFEALMTNRC